MKSITFNFGEITIQVNIGGPCFIYRTGLPIWGGSKDQLIKLLKSIHNGN